jgi:hypothetical protein
VTSTTPVSERVSMWAPRLGAELRVDVPVGRFAVGLRAGIDLAKLRGRQTARDPFITPPLSTVPQVELVRDGWLVSYPIDLSARYVF